MGPFPPANLDDGREETKIQAIRWIDNEKDDKVKLKTNKSDEDLNLKDIIDLKKVVTHRENEIKKRCIKPFVIDVNHLTGIKNFTQISKNPLAIPRDREFQLSGDTQYSEKKEDPSKPKVPMKKKVATFESKPPMDISKKEAGTTPSSRRQCNTQPNNEADPSHRGGGEIVAPSNDMFYKKNGSQ